MAVDFKDYARRMDKALDHLNEVTVMGAASG